MGARGASGGDFNVRRKREKKVSFFSFGGRPLLRFPPCLHFLLARACAARIEMTLTRRLPAPPEEEDDEDEEEASRHDFLFAFFFLSFFFLRFDRSKFGGLTSLAYGAMDDVMGLPLLLGL